MVKVVANRVSTLMEILTDVERLFHRARVDRVKYRTLFGFREYAFIPNYTTNHIGAFGQGSQEGSKEGCRIRDSPGQADDRPEYAVNIGI